MTLFDEHRATLARALEAIARREYWTPYPDSPRAYGDDAPLAGETAFRSRLGSRFELGRSVQRWTAGDEGSPYGIDLGIAYPDVPAATLLDAAAAAGPGWAAASPDERAGVCLEILDRLRAHSFEMAHAVMATTGQPFLLAFQTGGPHALDRGLEAVTHGHAETTRFPAAMSWSRPQGRREPVTVEKTWRLRPRGISVALGVSTLPTWAAYPGVFASLVTGNPVIVKPHPATILPLAIFVETARDVLADADFDPDAVLLAVDTTDRPIAVELVMDPRVGIVDYTGGAAFGSWLEANATHAEVFTAKSSANSVIVDSTDDLDGMARNLAASVALYSGQMCTTPRTVFVPRGGISDGDRHAGFTEVAQRIVAAIDSLLADDDRASDILGAVKSRTTLDLMAAAADRGDVLLASREVKHPMYPSATVRTPVVVAVEAVGPHLDVGELYGPVVSLVATDSTEQSLELAAASALRHGALSWLVHTTDDDVAAAAEDAAVGVGVPLTFNLTGGLLVNHTAAFSDLHGSGANPAVTAPLVAPAFVVPRFHVAGVRRPAG